jgi:hypothetical protein
MYAFITFLLCFDTLADPPVEKVVMYKFTNKPSTFSTMLEGYDKLHTMRFFFVGGDGTLVEVNQNEFYDKKIIRYKSKSWFDPK